MTDILVRVPMSEVDHFWEEADAAIEWWTLGVLPKQFLPGDYIFFALGQHVVAYAAGAVTKSGNFLLRSDDGRDWKGFHIVWDAAVFRRIEPPIALTRIGLQVPRGFAYCGHTQLRSIIAAHRSRQSQGSCT